MRSISSIVVAGACLGSCNAFIGAPLAARAPRLSSALRMQQDVVLSETKSGVKIDESGPLKKVILTTPNGHSAEICTMGACVTSFKVDNGYDVLFVRPDAKLDGSKPVSGGLPHCFPQFGPGKIQQHGFARNLEWEVVSQKNGVSPSVTLKLVDTPATLEMWPHKFECLYTVGLSAGVLSTTHRVINTGEEDFEFNAALHSYFRVSDVDQITIKNPGFLFGTYLDKTGNWKSQPFKNPNNWTMKLGHIFKIDQPVDMVWRDVTKETTIDDPAAQRSLKIRATHYKDTILWNPYGDEGMGYKNFVCVESGTVWNPIKLEAGREWVGKMDLVPGPLTKVEWLEPEPI